MDDFDIESVLVDLREHSLLLAAEGLAETPVYTLPSVTFQPTPSVFEVSAYYPSSITMGATLLHFESTFSGRLARAHRIYRTRLPRHWHLEPSYHFYASRGRARTSPHRHCSYC
jgi:hypothetical protein